MICEKPNCGGRLKPSNTWDLGDQKFQRAKCQKCGAIYCLETFRALSEGRGTGAKALAARARARRKGRPGEEAVPQGGQNVSGEKAPVNP